MSREPVSPQLEVLDCYRTGDGPLSAAELVERSGLPRSTGFRAVRRLADDGFLRRDRGGRRYVLGPRVLRLGMVARSQLTAHELVGAPLHALSRRIGETVTFNLLELPERVCAHVIAGPSDLRFEARVGQRYPLDGGAAGKVILAHLSTDTAADVLRRGGATTLRIREALKELATIRAAGWAFTDGDLVAGAVAVAAPVLVDGSIFGSVAAVGPSARLRTTMLEHRAAVVDVARELGRRLSGTELEA